MPEVRLLVVSMHSVQFGDRFQNIHSYIAAVIGNTLIICDYISECEAGLKCILLSADPFDMISLHRIADVIDDLLQRIDLKCFSVVIVCKREDGEICDFPDRILQYGELP